MFQGSVTLLEGALACEGQDVTDHSKQKKKRQHTVGHYKSKQKNK